MRLALFSFVLGIIALQNLADLPSPFYLAALVGLAGILLWARVWLGGRSVFVFLACALLGFVWAGVMAQGRLREALPDDWEMRDVEITGLIASLPQRFARAERFEVALEEVHTPEAKGKIPARLLVSWQHRSDEFDDDGALSNAVTVHPGERWRFTVRLKKPHGNANPQGFDYELWLLERGIRATGSVRPRLSATRLENFVWRPTYVVEHLRETIRQRFLSVLNEAPYAGVLIALAIGDQRAIPNAQWTLFNRTGITHLVSISGLHVTMVAALFAGLVNFLWRRSTRLILFCPAQKVAVLAGMGAALSYSVLAGFAIPAQRTLYMLCVVALCLWIGRHFGVVRVMLLALFGVCLLDPWAVLATGFWLSFGAVALLFFVSTARVFQRKEGHATLWRWGVAQWAVTLGSMPLLLYFFQQFSLVSPFANALAIPAVSFVITPLALLFALVPWPPLLVVTHGLLTLLMEALSFLSQWPIWQQAAPPLWATLLALIGALSLLLPRGFPARWCGVFLLLPALTWQAERPAEGSAFITFLDVGQGLAVFVQTAQHNLLYDTGPAFSPTSDAGQRVIVPFLRGEGVRVLDTLLVSHRDKDHSGGVRTVQENLKIRHTLSSLPELGGELCAAGQQWEWDGVHFSILYPPPSLDNAPLKANHQSCVLRIATAEQSVLLSADIEVVDEKKLLAMWNKTPERLVSRVVQVPHHGGMSSSSPAFVEAVHAQDAIFSVGYRNNFHHPRPEILARYAKSQVWRTDRDGAIRVQLSPTTRHISAWRRERARYWF